MEEATLDMICRVLRESRQELQKAAGNYGRLLDQLDELERALQAAQSAFLKFPHVQPLRRAAPTEDGLNSTRELVELLNRIVKLHAEASASRGNKGATAP